MSPLFLLITGPRLAAWLWTLGLLFGGGLVPAPAHAAMPVPQVQEMRLQFLDNGSQQTLGHFERGQVMPPVQAQIRYQGRGLLRARWEVVQPGDAAPGPLELAPEADLFGPLRAQQRRYTVLEHVTTYLPPSGYVTLPGPNPRRLPNLRDGTYTLLLRLQTTGLASATDVIRFRQPVLRYHIGPAANTAQRGTPPAEPLLAVAPQGLVPADRPLRFSWHALASAKLYRLELQRGGQLLHAARVRPDEGPDGLARYTLPGFVQQQLGTEPARWRVVTLDNAGSPLSASRWVALHWAAEP